MSRAHIGVQRVTAYRRPRRVKATRSLQRLIRAVVPLGGAFLCGGNRLGYLNGGAVGARQRAGRANNFRRVFRISGRNSLVGVEHLGSVLIIGEHLRLIRGKYRSRRVISGGCMHVSGVKHTGSIEIFGALPTGVS